jgi:hypothetical protein
MKKSLQCLSSLPTSSDRSPVQKTQAATWALEVSASSSLAQQSHQTTSTAPQHPPKQETLSNAKVSPSSSPAANLPATSPPTTKPAATATSASIAPGSPSMAPSHRPRRPLSRLSPPFPRPPPQELLSTPPKQPSTLSCTTSTPPRPKAQFRQTTSASSALLRLSTPQPLPLPMSSATVIPKSTPLGPVRYQQWRRPLCLRWGFPAQDAPAAAVRRKPPPTTSLPPAQLLPLARAYYLTSNSANGTSSAS